MKIRIETMQGWLIINSKIKSKKDFDFLVNTLKSLYKKDLLCVHSINKGKLKHTWGL